MEVEEGDRKRKKRDEILQFALQAPDIGWSALCRKTLRDGSMLLEVSVPCLVRGLGTLGHCECFINVRC